MALSSSSPAIFPNPDSHNRWYRNWGQARLLRVAAQVNDDHPSDGLERVLEQYQPERALPITVLTRQNILASLSELPRLEGKLELSPFLERIFDLRVLSPLAWYDDRFPMLGDNLHQHMVRNSDYSCADLFATLGLQTCSIRRFVAFLEWLVHPSVRDSEDQQSVAGFVNEHLRRDGVALVPTHEVSGYPVFTVQRLSQGVAGTPKNLIFAAAGGPKPKIVFRDAVNNDIEVVENAEYCLFYDAPVSGAGLLWRDLVDWWAARQGTEVCRDTERDLYKRLDATLQSEPERLLFRTYYALRNLLGDRLPALIPQVYLHYDPYLLGTLRRTLSRQRMDFLILFSPRERVVIEVDGIQHYADGDRTASPRRYADMVSADRALRLAGYEVYRFGGAEFVGSAASGVVDSFFRELLARHSVPLA